MADDFLTTYAPLANDIATRTGLDPATILGVIDTETGHGQHVSGNNIFGISPSGPQGQYVAGYPDVQTASNAFISLMQTPRYRGVAAAGDPASQAAALVRGGYNTANPAYAAIVARSAQSAAKQLGYQDSSGGAAQPGVSINATTSQPAAAPDYNPPGSPAPPAAAAPDYNTPARSPAPVQPSSGSAKDRVLADPALSGGDSSAAPAQPAATPQTAKDRLLADPALQVPSEKANGAQSPLADIINSPDAQDRPAGETPPTGSEIVNALQPAPNTTYGNIVPVARDDKTGAYRLAMPNALRDPLLSLLTEGPQVTDGKLTVPGATFDPATSSLGVTPGAAGVGMLAATPLRFGAFGPAQSALIDATRAPPVTGVAPVDADAIAARQSVRNALQPPAEGGASAAAPSTPVPSGFVQPTPPPTPSPSAGPQPAGAAVTPPGAATLTPKEVDAYRATAEGNKLLENQRIGEPDRTAYIPGVTPNSVEQEQTATAARELKSLGVTSPEASDEAKLAAQSNNDARTSYYQDTARSPVDIQKAEDARAQQAEADLKATWANKTDADASPVLDEANAIKASPDGRRPAVRSAIDSVTSELTDANGNLITDPEQLYGVRKHIDDLLSKEGQRETPLAARATTRLQDLKDSLDAVIEQAAPGFKQYLKNFSDASKPIDEMGVLQDAMPGLFKGPGATMRYSDFQRFMKNVVDMRQANGINPYKSISDDTMQRLWNLRDDLRRSASAQELARAPGSDTAPNIIDAMRQYARLGGATAVDVAASHIFGPIAGPMIARGVRAVAAPIAQQRAAATQMGRMREMLYPTNPLQPPPGTP